MQAQPPQRYEQQEALNALDRLAKAGPFLPDWQSLRAYRVPAWYAGARFGIFIHWGLYAVPAYDNEWYPRNMYLPDTPAYRHHLATYGPPERFGYKDFIPHFRAERFDPAAWAALCQEAGARFVVPVAEHHDGFAMYRCSFSRWNAVDMGPRRDIIGELAEAVRARGLTFGLSSHRAEHWWFFNGGRAIPSDVQDPQYADLYGPARPEDEPPDAAFLADWLARLYELVERYRPALIYFDWWISRPAFRPYLARFAAYYYNRAAHWGQEVVITYKEGAFEEGSAVEDIERGRRPTISPRVWQADTSLARNSWGYTIAQDYKPFGAILDDLIDTVSKNGVFLLNIGPRADGSIPEPEADLLRRLGRWLTINGEAIYDSQPWHLHGEGPTTSAAGPFSESQQTTFTEQDLRFTRRGPALYVLLPVWPRQGRISIQALAAGSPHYPQSIGAIHLLGGDAPLSWRRDDQGLHIDLPADPPGERGGALKILPAS
ncbi:alpha-L-fucosidase [Thermogemmatispora sp.]|uniref:alpha-L-fucosidase n=2 Tax=Thermogemmatispora sp. TaxID=1968838 RepID=UPI002ACBE822|nr:alpha-L-fucosidase [Thermogemmatispora sp.]